MDRCLSLDWPCALREQRVVHSVWTQFAQDAPRLNLAAKGQHQILHLPRDLLAGLRGSRGQSCQVPSVQALPPACIPRTGPSRVPRQSAHRPLGRQGPAARRRPSADDVLQHGFLPMAEAFSVGGLPYYWNRPYVRPLLRRGPSLVPKSRVLKPRLESGCRILSL
ncbi:MAG: hypothetical protein EWM73_02839 [Nitrospira sp.]|nr:MAG: hypothetical protein EWM73_02839 [Nitrospira sp.]